jgi:hypothetical protein
MHGRFPLHFVYALLAVFAFGCNDDGEKDSCQPDDADGQIGGDYDFEVIVNDEAFTPAILTTQNESEVVLQFTNEGSSPLGFFIECLPTPNDRGCATESCFPKDAEIEPLGPGESAKITFETPIVEGIYRIFPSEDGTMPEAQWVIR